MITAERQIITPADEAEWLKLRRSDITSTDVAALFGCSPYMTLFELWHRKRNQVAVDFKANERMRWGTRLQEAIARGIGEDQGWALREMKEYVRLPELKIGSSFDFSIERLDPENASKYSKEPLGILEVKNVDGLAFRDGWSVEGEDVEAPPHIEMQVQHQLLTSGRELAFIGALVGGNQVVLIRREPDVKIIQAILLKVAQFWESIEKNQEPSPNFEKDAGFIIGMHQFAEPGKVFDASGDAELQGMIDEYVALGRAVKMGETARAEIKAKVLLKIQDAEKVTSPLFTISAGLIGPAHLEYDRKGYRDFKVFPKKEKIKNG